ncbi:hypothetical protein [Laspinema olomoucense]|uniref:hypothetical protein n=1 Tax=Laspinema olomoucense TaxID=3231600 RepID=UPI0021BA971E|nr:hypothetical protein [Laspinema sp. D3a]MCT7992051.1 hypothetical protein [Laspinema sp. D3a]
MVESFCQDRVLNRRPRQSVINQATDNRSDRNSIQSNREPASIPRRGRLTGLIASIWIDLAYSRIRYPSAKVIVTLAGGKRSPGLGAYRISNLPQQVPIHL